MESHSMGHPKNGLRLGREKPRNRVGVRSKESGLGHREGIKKEAREKL